MRVSQTADFSQMRIAVTRNHFSERMRRILDQFGFSSIVRRGSVGLKIGLVASGECDIYIHPGSRTKLWDACGPQIILEEAGGQLTDTAGQKIRYDSADVRNLRGLLATNGIAHEAAVKRLAQAAAAPR
jgi:3'(2'), 5'-bisphosphate nucleotidase